ncbi:MAG: dienelactone hydrolase family protein [Gammaproteobacteria bacterium]|nr:dienelactone hydrolase family protein [Rhodocyclaceae bacterium]MBU3909583.1 dienelactone hydrolase family protein [Gammaproteobacteria bacterium]MBU3989165.1 dienelactone hydrolase family protein [Gammaproteobacteria bacterium]MBU4003246.1 dienelactone hydrolase family protein [Gammaproteobacteria bacterium]MBU4022295.1 dienelactone hydrolase family protein [Gammaproteobacteria bacterium]
MGEMIEFARPDGSGCTGYLAAAGTGKPAVIIIQEWWGLNPQICGVADRFAEAGFTALAPDLYHGRVTQDPDEASHLMTGLDFPGATHQDLRGAVLHLRQQAGKVGVMGFCMGGALTIAAAVHIPEITSAVCLYGIPPQDFADPAKIRIPFMGHFANLDDWCTPQAVDQLEQSMRAAGQTPEIYRYAAAHAFCNEQRPEVYDPACAKLAMQRTLDFFGRTLT